MRWRKLGLIFMADRQYPWMVTHAANPTAEVIGKGLVRVYFGTRDAENRSSIAAAVLTLTPKPTLLDLSAAPLLAPGERGSFDDSGVSMGCIVRTGGLLRLYYLGWNLGVTVPWRNSIGLAVSADGGRSFTKSSLAPLLDRNETDPYSLSYPWILPDLGKWRMWYGSNLRWGAAGQDMKYVVKYAESSDGLVWVREGHIALPLVGDEYALARPCVLRDADCYRMWFTHRGDRYLLGYAESHDGLSWRRDDQAVGLDPSPAGWDAEMVEYPCVFDCDEHRYMLYNGNGYGRTGFGLAVLA